MIPKKISLTVHNTFGHFVWKKVKVKKAQGTKPSLVQINKKKDSAEKNCNYILNSDL